MNRRILALMAVSALALSLAACGGDSGLGKEELIAKGDRNCAEGQKAIDQKVAATFQSSPTTDEMVAFVRDQAVPAYRKQVNQLKALEPDNGSKEDWDNIITKLDQGLKQFAEDPATVVNSGSSPLEEAGQAARDFGMKVCGSRD